MATFNDLDILQFDVRTAFLYGKVHEDIYMEVPEGLQVEDRDLVCKLNKALYGLKQASRCWHQTLVSYLNDYNFSACESDNSLFIGNVKNEYVFLVLFVDDGLVLYKSRDISNYIIGVLQKRFEITVNEPNTFVGMQIMHNRSKGFMILHQTDYIEKVLDRYNMSECKPVCTPMEKGLNLAVNKEEGNCQNSKIPYRELIGSLMFLVSVSRPDLAYSVGYLSRFLDCYDETHWEAGKRVLRYLRGTSDRGVMFTKINNFKPIGYCDADYAGDCTTRRPTSGYIFFLANGLVSWMSQRQATVALSSTEAEYLAACAAAKE